MSKFFDFSKGLRVGVPYGPTTDDGNCRYGKSSGRGKGGSVIWFESVTSKLRKINFTTNS
jgi:hypothetical protein